MMLKTYLLPAHSRTHVSAHAHEESHFDMVSLIAVVCDSKQIHTSRTTGWHEVIGLGNVPAVKRTI